MIEYETSGVLKVTQAYPIKTSIFLVMHYKSFFNCSHGNISKEMVVINQMACLETGSNRPCGQDARIMPS